MVAKDEYIASSSGKVLHAGILELLVDKRL